jgi:hypothetical protein
MHFGPGALALGGEMLPANVNALALAVKTVAGS